MLKYLIIAFFLAISLFLCAVDEPASVETTAISDSLLKSIVARVREEFGVTETSTLEQTAKLLEVDLLTLKKQLGLDVRNSKLDTMRLRQLGVSTYQILLAQQTIEYGFNDISTLAFISAKFNVPIKKLKFLLGLDANDPTLNNRSIQSIDISLGQVRDAIVEFEETLYSTGANIILVGMLVVFASLFFTSVIIMQLRHLNFARQDKITPPKIKLNADGKLLSAHPNVSHNEIVAVITAMHIYRMKLLERRHLNLTFQRDKANYWRAAGIIAMPNRNFKK
jgi:hypothetical protein